jgi:hypothetical protein
MSASASAFAKPGIATRGPHAVLLHAESASCGYEDTEDKQRRFATAIASVKPRWGWSVVADPYDYPNLTLEREGFDVAATLRPACAATDPQAWQPL